MFICCVLFLIAISDATKGAAKERVYEYRIEGNQNLQKAGQVLKLFTDDSIAKTASFQEVQAKAFEILERQKLDFVAEHIVSQAKFDETAFQWEHVDKLAPQFKRNLRPVLLSVEFATSSGHMPLMAAINFLKAAFQKGRSLTQYSTARFPTEFIPDSTKRYLYTSGEDDQKLLRDRYEFLVYRLLRNGLESGDVFCRDSVRFRSLEDDLIDEQRWQAIPQIPMVQMRSILPYCICLAINSRLVIGTFTIRSGFLFILLFTGSLIRG